jgi:hypothetical protein
VLRSAHPYVQSLLVQAVWRMSRSTDPRIAGLRVEEQRPEIAELARGHPDRRKAIIREQLQQRLRVAPIMFVAAARPYESWPA